MAAWALLGLYRLLIGVLPFRLIRRLLGESRSTSTVAVAEIEPAQRARATQIGAVVRAAARHTPWRSDCYPQALAARTFLAARRIPHTVSFGVRRDGAALLAHAWVGAGGVPVTGGDGTGYTVVGSFSWSPRGRRSTRRHVGSRG